MMKEVNITAADFGLDEKEKPKHLFDPIARYQEAVARAIQEAEDIMFLEQLEEI